MSQVRGVGISFEEVAEAAETLQAQGENPTIHRVRAFLGDTGSNTTISKYLNTWRAGLPKAGPSESASPPDPVQTAVKRVWQQIREETDAEIQTIKSETQAIIQEAESQAQHALKEAEQLRVECQVLQQQVYALEAHKEIQLLDFKKLEAEHALLQERHKNLDERYADFQAMTVKHQTEMAEAHKKEIQYLTEKTEAQLSAAQKSLAELKTSTQEERERHSLETEKLKAGNLDLENKVALLQSTLTAKDLDLRELNTQLAAAINERERLAAQLTGQEKYWELFEKNSHLTKDIWAEIKEIPKFDFGLSYINLFSEIQDNIGSSMEKLGKVTNEAKLTLELFKNGNHLNTNDE